MRKEAAKMADTMKQGSRKSAELTWAGSCFLHEITGKVAFSEQRGELLVWGLWQEETPQRATRRTLSRHE